jgi:oligopeptide/dipeptide ABC transporter ATP-binding protein
MTDALLRVDGLKKFFTLSDGQRVHAVDDVSFSLSSGETLGLVGESGCGKSTLGRTIIRLLSPDAGTVHVNGKNLARLSDKELKPLRREIQMIFQDPYASLNPRSTVGRAIEEPLIVHGVKDPRARAARVSWLLERVGLPSEAAQRHPHEFSGGQRQRIGIARALALNPKLIICDEPVSALDVSVRAQVLNLLADLREELGLSYLFISHDLSVVEHFCDRVAVMYLGRIVELAPRHKLWSQPLHPYTHTLLDAAPLPDPTRRRGRRTLVEGEIPNPIDRPNGCHFHTRCVHKIPICSSVAPPLISRADGHEVACHRAEDFYTPIPKETYV